MVTLQTRPTTGPRPFCTPAILVWFLCAAVVLGLAPGRATVRGEDADPTLPPGAEATAADTPQEEAVTPQVPDPPDPSDEGADEPANSDSLETKGELHKALGSGAVVAVIGIHGMIYDFTLESLKRRVERARKLGADVIVLEMKTPGGVLIPALEISRYLKSLPEPTVAWINDEAYSAGILIASSCKQIVMAKHSATGDCAPIAVGGSLGPREVKKALGPLLAEFRDNAKTNGYSYVLLHAMCVEGVKVYRLRQKQSGQVRFVNEADYQFMVRGESSLGPDTAAQGRSTTAPSQDADAVLGAVVQTVVSEDERSAWELDDDKDKPSPLVYDGSTFMTVTDSEAMELGLARAIVDNNGDLKKHLKAGQVLRVNPTWSEGLAAKLTHPMVRAALVLALLLGAYMEFQAPGLGMPGLVALVALITLIGAPFLVGLAETWHLILFFIGFLLLVVEVLVTPGFGLLGVAGMLCMLLGLILQVVPSSGAGPMPLPAPEMLDQLIFSTLWTMLGIVASFVGLYYLTKHFGEIPILNRLILSSPATVPATDGAVVPVSGDEVIGGGAIAVGAAGRAVTGLRPTGRADVDGKTIDVITRGDWIDVGHHVRVVEVHGNRVVVEPSQ